MNSRPRFYFSPNPLDRANPTLHLLLFDGEEMSYHEYRMGFQEAFSFTAKLSQEIAEIALRNPAIGKQTKIREIDADPMEDVVTPTCQDAQQPASNARRGILDRILGRE
jgi:hypothetical protein